MRGKVKGSTLGITPVDQLTSKDQLITLISPGRTSKEPRTLENTGGGAVRSLRYVNPSITTTYFLLSFFFFGGEEGEGTVQLGM